MLLKQRTALAKTRPLNNPLTHVPQLVCHASALCRKFTSIPQCTRSEATRQTGFRGTHCSAGRLCVQVVAKLRGTDSFDSFSGTTPEPLWTVLEIGASARQEGVSEKLLSKHVQIWFLWPSRGLRGSDASFSASQATPSRVVVDGLASLRAGM